MKYFFTFALLVICFQASATIYTVTDTGTAGGNQLISFINQANSGNDLDTIFFDIAGLPPFNINMIGFTLPSIDSPLFIDGFSQLGNDSIVYSIRILTNLGLLINSSNCNIRGLYFQGNHSVGSKGINVSVSTGDSISGIEINHNYFTRFDDAIQFSSYGNIDSEDLIFESNTFIDNNSCLDIGNKFINIRIAYNRFINSSSTRFTFGSPATDSIYFIGNTYDSSGMWLSGNLKRISLQNNVFINHSSLNLLSSSVDSVMINSNIFNKNSSVLIYLSDFNNDLIISENVFDSLCSFELSLESASDVYTLKNVFITENNFHDFSGVRMSFGGTLGTRSITNLNISRNIFSISPGSIPKPLFIQLSGTAGITKVDSVIIDSNLFNRSFIEYTQSGTGGIYAGSNIYIHNNIIDSAEVNPGIQINTSKTILTEVSIGDNEISYCMNGISISNYSIFGYSTTMLSTNITGNYIHDNDSSGIYIENIPLLSNVRLANFFIASNVIKGNSGDGIKISCSMDPSATENTISDLYVTQNQINHNAGYGIHFIEYGTTLINYRSPVISNINYSMNSIVNNTLKGIWIENIDDPNNPSTPIYPFPIITHISSIAGLSDVWAYMQGDTLTNYKIEIFGNLIADSTGFGEGETYLDSLIVSTDNSGLTLFQFSGLVQFPFYSCTATNLSTGNTSVFGNSGDSTTAIQNLATPSSEIFLNPERNTLNIKRNNAELIRGINIFNSIGQKQERISIPSIINDEYVVINLANLSAGIYFIEVLTDKRILVKKFVKEWN